MAEDQEFKRGWPVVLAAFLGVALGVSSIPYGIFGGVARAMTTEFQWSFSQFMSGFLILAIGTGTLGPVVGHLADRYGARRVVLISAPLFAASLLSFAFNPGDITLYYASWIATTALGIGTIIPVWTLAVAGWFAKNRGLAVGLTVIGTGTFSAISRPVVGIMVGDWGWRPVFVVAALLPILIVIPMSLWRFREHPDVVRARTTTPKTETSSTQQDMSLLGTMKSWRLWVIIVGAGIPCIAFGGIVTNYENILAHTGISASDALKLTPVLGLSIVAGRVSSGFFLDRFWASAVAAVLFSFGGLGFFLLSGSSITTAVAVLGVFLLGFSGGAQPTTCAYMVPRYFGMASFGSIFGLLNGLSVLLVGLGPSAFSLIFDGTGSYEMALLASAISMPLSGIALLLLGPYRYGLTPAT